MMTVHRCHALTPAGFELTMNAMLKCCWLMVVIVASCATDRWTAVDDGYDELEFRARL
jgi:hypothetical protein